MTTAGGVGVSDDGRSLIGRYCTEEFPIVEANWTDTFTPDAITGMSISSLPQSGSTAILPLDDLSGITNAEKTGVCLGVSGEEPTGYNVALFSAFDDPGTNLGPQLWVWYNLPTPTPTPTP